ncbi:MAG: GNAT family N-acetyltransferase [Anaerolineae bacterium]|nr:GNAT family N-acetyltransferase [Anaerolineae bacterium]
MQALDRDRYERVRPLFTGLRYNLVVDSILDGHTPAWVYADDAEAPRTAWLWNRMDAMLLAGHAGDRAVNRSLAALIRDRVIPDARRRHIPALSLHYHPDAWQAQAGVILEGLQPEQAPRRYYRFDRLRVDWRPRLPSGAEMRAIDEELLAGSHLHNVESVAGWVLSFWATPADFVRAGLGRCLLRGDEILSWCLTVYASGRHRELGVATVPAHRGRGLATLAAAACVERCLEQGFTPHWHCWEENTASIALAGKLGFVDPIQYEVFRFAL